MKAFCFFFGGRVNFFVHATIKKNTHLVKILKSLTTQSKNLLLFLDCIRSKAFVRQLPIFERIFEIYSMKQAFKGLCWWHLFGQWTLQESFIRTHIFYYYYFFAFELLSNRKWYFFSYASFWNLSNRNNLATIFRDEMMSRKLIDRLRR